MRRKVLFCWVFSAMVSFTVKAQVYDTVSYPNINDSVTIDWEKLGVGDSSVVKSIKQLTTNEYNDFVQCWGVNPFSPDGKKILYTSRIDGGSSNNSEIVMMDIDGTDKVRLTMNDYCNGHANFTPDGKSIVHQVNLYYEEHSEDYARIFISPLDSMIAKPDSLWGKNLTEIAGYPDDDTFSCYIKPVLDNTGTKIAFKKGEEEDEGGIYVMNIDGSGIVCVSDTIENASHHVWSPDSKWIAFQSCLGNHDSSRIFITKSDGSIDPIQISPQSFVDSSWCSNWPAWSPDGKWISYHVKPGWNDFPNSIILYNVAKDTNIVFVSNDTLNICAPTSWDPTSEWLAYKMQSDVGINDREIAIKNIYTNENIKLTAGYYDYRQWFLPDGNGILIKEQNYVARDGNKFGYDLLLLTFEKDLIRPVAKTKDITIYVNESCNTTITAADVDNNSWDNIGITNKSIDITTFDCDVIDTTLTVVLTVEDAAGNTDTAHAKVTVLSDFSGTTTIANKEFRLYPNPANDYLRFEIPGMAGANIEIYDYCGRKVLHEKITQSQDIDISTLNAGMYLVKVSSNNINEFEKIIIRR